MLEIPEELALKLEEDAILEGTSKTALLETALTRYRHEIHARRLEEYLDWYLSLPSKQREKYAGKFIAVHEKLVIDSDEDRPALYRRVRSQYKKKPVLIIPWDGPKELRIISTRIVPE
jgi:hypothetical protein